MDANPSDDESRRKRVKLSSDGQAGFAAPSTGSTAPEVDQSLDAQASKELEVGITLFVSPEIAGFSGVVKKRYTDFLVNEILPSGKVLHLGSLEVPAGFRPEKQAKEQPVSENVEEADKKEEGVDAPADSAATEQTNISEEDKTFLEKSFGPEIAQKVIKLSDRALAKPGAKLGEQGRVQTNPIADKDTRTTIHQAIRRIFSSRLESSTDGDGSLVIMVVPRKKRRGQPRGRGDESRHGKLGWSELGGEYLHFTAYKENKDTMETVSYLARQMKLGMKSFQFAGTKDRRGVTVQRVSGFRLNAGQLANVGKTLRNAAIGDYEYHTQGLELGDLGGNEFVVTLRDCQFEGDIPSGEDAISVVSERVATSLRNLRERGYFNYYGLQRFGTFSTSTDTVGLKMLQGDFKGACDCILHYTEASLAAGAQNPEEVVSADDVVRAEAIRLFQTTGNSRQALEKLPRKFSAESNVIRHLGHSKNDFYGALQTIPRNLRLMYVHAYQSLVWNFAASERWRLYGDRVVEGDLVLVNDFKDTTQDPAAADEVDADGEAVILPSGADRATTADDIFERARALTADEAASGTYTIFDIVLPLPGFDLLYPANEMTEFYRTFMGSERGGKLDPFDMRRKWRDISLSGSYRKLLSRPGADYSFEVKRYRQEDEQFVETDLERLRGKGAEPKEEKAKEEANKLAVVIKFQLGPSQYATMALRELMKTGGAREYKPDRMGGRQ